MLFLFIALVFLAGRALTSCSDWLLCCSEHKPVIKPVITHKQITGKLFVVEIVFCELWQVVTFFHDLVGEIFFIVILSQIFVLKIPYKIVRIFLVIEKLPIEFVKILLIRIVRHVKPPPNNEPLLYLP